MPGSKEEDFLRNISILQFLHQITSPWGGGVMKFTISCLLILQMLHTKFSPVVFEKKMLTHDGRQPIARVTHAGDLKMFYSP